jgi:hypothetical protein
MSRIDGNSITKPADEHGVSYFNQAEGIEIIMLPHDSTKAKIAYIGIWPDGEARISSMPVAKFNEVHAILHVEPKETAAALLKKAVKISPAALDHLERIFDMDTRGKSKDQIGAEVARVAEGLPVGHSLRNTPKKFKDRAGAIAALTAVRHAQFLLTQPKSPTKESNMTKKATPAAKTPAAAKPAKATAKPAAAAVEEVKVTKAKDTGSEKPAAAKPTPAAEKLAEKAAEKTKKAKGRSDITGPFVLGTAVGKAKTPEELRMHEGSARYKLMAFALSSKKSKFTMEDFEAQCGDQTLQSVTLCIKKGYLAQAK